VSRAVGKTDLFRVCVSSVVSAIAAVLTVLILQATGQSAGDTLTQMGISGYVVGWPVYTAVYVGWGALVYSRLDRAALRRVTAADSEEEHRPLPRLLGLTGTTNTTVSAAIVAVVVTVAIAQRPEFRGNFTYSLMALVTVGSSWILVVFAYAQSYLRLGTAELAHFRFHFPETPRFSDYFTLALLVSTMAPSVSANPTSRTAWTVVRSNVVVAFVFNSVIIAMMVSLLFGGLLA
jgi:uncharacterized membrane protein